MKRSIAIAIVATVAVIAASGGYFLGHSASRKAPTLAAVGTPGEPSTQRTQIYTCSMHPQVRLDHPGNCPICEMPLIPAASASTAEGEAPMLQLSEHALAMASVETVAVERRPLRRELRTVGRIEYNEWSLGTITPRVDGYAERLFVNFTGVEIRKGDQLAEVYSPELLVAQEELLIALQSGADSALAEVAQSRLRLLGLTDQQIVVLVEKKQTTDVVTFYSPISGTVIEKNIIEKSAFKAGDALYRIANLDSVWVYLEIYEYDLPWVRYGQKVRISAEAIPGRTFDGVVTFVQPIVNDQTRTIRVPVPVENKDHALKPGMFVTAVIEAVLTNEGRAAPTGVEGRYSCPMHPQVIADAPGPCPICQMPLEKIPGDAVKEAAPADVHAEHDAVPMAPKFLCPMKCEGEKTYDQPGHCPVCKMKLKEVPAGDAVPSLEGGVLTVPVTAVLDSGTRQIVYIEKSRGLFEPRELKLGPRAGDYYSVLSGLSPGERVVSRGNFLIDSQFQVTGHASLFYPGGLNASMGHQHDASKASSPTTPTETPASGKETTVKPPAAHKH
jgi:Cu(I)/Ag(I) efflux system membrane fusion protein